MEKQKELSARKAYEHYLNHIGNKLLTYPPTYERFLEWNFEISKQNINYLLEQLITMEKQIGTNLFETLQENQKCIKFTM